MLKSLFSDSTFFSFLSDDVLQRYKPTNQFPMDNLTICIDYLLKEEKLLTMNNQCFDKITVSSF